MKLIRRARPVDIAAQTEVVEGPLFDENEPALGISDLGFIHLLSGEGSFAEKFFTVIEQLLSRIQRFFGGPQVRLRLGHFFRNRGISRRFIIRVRLFVLPLAFPGSRSQIAIFEHGQQLALTHMIAAIDVKLPHRRADLRRHAGLVQWKEYAVGGNDAPDGIQADRSHLHRHDGLRFLFFFLGAGSQRQQA